MRSTYRLWTLFTILLPLTMAQAAPPALSLAWPVDCMLGRSCAIQNYPDNDPGPGVRDHAGYARTYQGHDGTDIRLLSMAAERRGAAVLAAAAGTVLRVRDGVADRSIRDQPTGTVLGVECGNGVVIDHGGGWETQYCHLRQGSIVVRAGQKVGAGSALGQVGLSGNTEFPHLHLTVRKDGRAVDPFAFRDGTSTRSLWQQTPTYRAGEVLVAGFAASPVEFSDILENGADQQPRPDHNSALVAFVVAIGLQAGDIQQLTLLAPDGSVLARNKPYGLDRDKAQQMMFVGRGHAPEDGWPRGTYRLQYQVTRGGKVVVTRNAELAL